jgi:hypothetical protein
MLKSVQMKVGGRKVRVIKERERVFIVALSELAFSWFSPPPYRH